MNKRCDLCEYFVRWPSQSTTCKSGQCYYNPPIVNNSFISSRPEVNEDDFCSKFQRLPLALCDDEKY